MRCRTVVFALALSLVSALATPAGAQPTASTDVEAHAIFEAGRTAYQAGRFQDALGYFERAYELSHRPELLYNIGQCQDRLRHDAEAIGTFEQFEAALPDAPQHDEVSARLAILRASSHATTEPEAPAAETTPAPVEPVADPVPPPAASSGSDATPWIVLGVGGALVVAGAILLGGGYADVSMVESARNVPFASVSGPYDAAPILTAVGWASLGVGLGMAAIGLGWGLASAGGGNGEHARLRIGPTGISITGSF